MRQGRPREIIHSQPPTRMHQKKVREQVIEHHAWICTFCLLLLLSLLLVVVVEVVR